MAVDPPPRSAPALRPFTRAQTRQNAAFLRELERTGNAQLSARSAGVAMGTLLHRRRRRPAFATAWDAALAMGRARLDPAGETIREEGRLVRLKGGGVQLRRHQATRNPPERYQAFLAALSATANVALSAAAAGLPKVSVYHRRRNNPGFAREMRLALETGYRRLEEALLESWLPEAHDHDAWRHNDPPPIPPMTAEQALHVLTLHRKTVEELSNPLPRRRGESWEEWSLRAALLGERLQEREREKFRLAEAARRGGGAVPGETAPVLPALEQVTGWSRAKRRAERKRGKGPFGGWRGTEDA